MKWSIIAIISAGLSVIFALACHSEFYSLLEWASGCWFCGVACICGAIEKGLHTTINITDKRPVVFTTGDPAKQETQL